MGTIRESLLPPAVLDLIEQVRNPRDSIYTQDNILARLEAIEHACHVAAEDFRKRRAKKLGAMR
jgi:hypothetical protein